MKVLLLGLMPRLFQGWVHGEHFLCVEHQGKSDLDKSIPRKLSAWKMPGDRFVILRDNDGAICADVKAKLKRMCKKSGRPDTLVRLVCQELESWYVGDLTALAQAFADDRLSSPSLQKRFKNPDEWQKPSVELMRLIPTFQKGSAARQMAEVLGTKSNRSRSFQVFVEGVARVRQEMTAGG